MKYLEWNNVISEFFFNPANAGKDVHLYLTRNDIISIASQHFNEETEDEIEEDEIEEDVLEEEVFEDEVDDLDEDDLYEEDEEETEEN